MYNLDKPSKVVNIALLERHLAQLEAFTTQCASKKVVLEIEAHDVLSLK